MLPAIAVDVSRDACMTYRQNFPDADVINGDILDLEPFRVLERLGGRGVDVIIGGPPCTPFSKSGFWLDWKREGLDPRAGLVSVFGRYVDALRPSAFVLENVPGLASPRSPYRRTYLDFLDRMTRAGYLVDAGVLNAADYGVAQVRRRLFVVGLRGGVQPILPTERLPHINSSQALAGLLEAPEPSEALSGKWANLVPLIPAGENYLHLTAERGYPNPLFEWRSRYWSFLLKLDPERPSPTIQAQPGPATGPFHWENRKLRLGELRRLFGYPDEYLFWGSRASAQRQIGDSVPPPLAAAVVGSIVRAVRDASGA